LQAIGWWPVRQNGSHNRTKNPAAANQARLLQDLADPNLFALNIDRLRTAVLVYQANMEFPAGYLTLETVTMLYVIELVAVEILLKVDFVSFLEVGEVNWPGEIHC
jgi:hypothetical protein